jgi:hypothetical protein
MEEIEASLAIAGFAAIKVYGSMKMESFNPEHSKDLVILARKSTEETSAR